MSTGLAKTKPRRAKTMVKINGKKITGLQDAAMVWHYNNLPGFAIEIFFSAERGEVWAKLMPANSWTVIGAGDDTVKLDAKGRDDLNYRQKLAWLRQAVADALSQK